MYKKCNEKYKTMWWGQWKYCQGKYKFKLLHKNAYCLVLFYEKKVLGHIKLTENLIGLSEKQHQNNCSLMRCAAFSSDSRSDKFHPLCQMWKRNMKVTSSL